MTKSIPFHDIKTKVMMPAGFDILRLGVRTSEYDSEVPHRHTFYELFVFQSGTAKHEIDFITHTAKPGLLHLVRPGQIHRLTSKDAKGYVLCFTEEFVKLNSKTQTDGFKNLIYGSNVIRPAENEYHDVRSITEMIFRLKKDPIFFSTSRHLLNAILILLGGNTNNTHSVPTTAVTHTEKYKKLVEQNFKHHFPLKYYADKLNITPNHLNALCQQNEGRNATRILHERIILEAKRLLYATDSAVKEISFALNFDNTAYFNRFFKKNTGYTPQSYRQMIRNR